VDIKAYISSGILESYVLGDLSAAEQKAVESMVQLHPEIKAELEVIEIQFESMAMDQAISPTLSFDQIATKLESSISTANISETNSSKSKLAKTVDISKYRMISMAASVAALIFGGLALHFYTKYQTAEQDLLAIRQTQEEYASNYQVIKNDLDQLQSDVTVMTDRSYSRIALAGTDNAPDAMAYVYWNNESKDVQLSISKLKQLSDDQQYQLWTIVDGKPVDQGVFNWDDKGLIALKSATGNVAAFAVTIEPKGGSTSPTLSTMQVLGEVNPSS